MTQSLSAHFLDQFGAVELFLITIFVMLLIIEVGYRFAQRPNANPAKAQHSQVRAIMGASLGLTAFMLAFTFATAQSHYESRVQLMLEETRVANNAFLEAEFLAEPERTQARRLIQEYLTDRVALRGAKPEKLLELVNRAEMLHEEMWTLAVRLVEQDPVARHAPGHGERFLDSVVSLMNLHTARVEAALVNRISYVIWIILYMTYALSMLVMGYQSGLVGRRSPIATVTLAISFSLVMMLITDLDRPIMSLFEFNSDVVEKTLDRMNRILPPEAGG